MNLLKPVALLTAALMLLPMISGCGASTAALAASASETVAAADTVPLETDSSKTETDSTQSAATADSGSSEEEAAPAATTAPLPSDKSDYFTDTLASYGSSFDTTNTAKETNLTLACAEIDGTVLQPGEVFSFNDTVGERTAEKGYQEASAYVGGSVTPELGGGICQVASTIYYCVLYACLEVVDREPHQYIVHYVPGGMDATVYWGYQDFQFSNNTSWPIRIDASVSDGHCWITIKGTTEHHYIAVFTSELTSYEPYGTITWGGTSGDDVDGINGYTYEITRTIYDADTGEQISYESTEDLGELGTSKYSERDAVIYQPNAEYGYSYEAGTETSW